MRMMIGDLNNGYGTLERGQLEAREREDAFATLEEECQGSQRIYDTGACARLDAALDRIAKSGVKLK